uniref:Sulfur/thiosulfate oxidation protein SoxD n=1 Tax=uncultured bacterium ws101A12 TaxID=1131826 RepID=I1X4F5_9BACT|nr:sulfur/thiosulfate oxidation protein SoxD [uncultured bacterium ws101A12]
MSKFLNLAVPAFGGAVVMGLVAYNFADRNITDMPATPDRSEAIAAYTAPPPTPLMAAVAQDGDGEGVFGLGRVALPEEVAAWDLDVSPDGDGLPVGSGDVWTGEEIFADYCAICHGDFAEGIDNWPKLAGGQDTLDRDDPLKTVGSYWPHLTTTWDYVNRSMPFGNAQTLEPDEVYAIVAYILYSNDLVDDDFVLSNETLLDVVMPNADGFVVDDREETEAGFWKDAPCMENCKESVEITMRATVLDVTPEETRARRVQELVDATRPGAREDAPAEAVVAVAEEAVAETGDGAAEAAVEEVAVSTADPALVAEGEKLFRQCKTCHQVGDGAKHRTGPHLNGVIGRAAGGADGFRYSGAFDKLAEDGVVWNAETLAAFLADPKGYARGTRMSFRGIKDADDLAAMTAYLATFE